MMKKAYAYVAWLAVLAILAAFGCASENNGYTDADASAEVLDVRPDEANAGDDCCGDSVPDGSEDQLGEVVPDVISDIVPEVVPEVVPDVVPDIEDSVEDEVPLPVRCDLSGTRDCSPGPGGGYCPDGASVFTAQVNGAIDATIAAHPEWFNASPGPGINSANVNDYMQAVTDILYDDGFCASGPGEELGVKLNNECSESWDIVATPAEDTYLVRRHYVGNCFPAFF